MSQLCFVTTCMGRLGHLRQSLPRLVGQPGTSCVVVDYSCPEQCGDWVAATHPAVQVVRVPGQTRFSVSAARNAGAARAAAPWLCFMDADVLLDPHFSRTVLPQLRARTFYLAQPAIPELAGAVICPRADFERIGGYDEVLRGWGRDDYDLYERLELVGLARGAFAANLATPLPHADDLRTQFHDVKDRWLSETINHLYSQTKLDLMRLTRQYLTLEFRQQLYAQINELARQAQQAPAAQQLGLDYVRLRLANGWHATMQLRLVIDERTDSPRSP